MDDNSLDVMAYGPRLRKLAFAAIIGLVMTYFSVKGMTHSGRGPNHDPVGVSSVGMVAFAMFIVTTLMAHKIMSKQRKRA